MRESRFKNLRSFMSHALKDIFPLVVRRGRAPTVRHTPRKIAAHRKGGGRIDDLVLLKRRVEALQKFLDTEDGRNLLAGFKRATNIVRIEEKKDKRRYSGIPDPKLYKDKEEAALAFALQVVMPEARSAIERHNFESAISAMARLRPAVDAFFEKVTVNADDPKLRENRLKLLNEIREATRAVADFSRIEG